MSALAAAERDYLTTRHGQARLATVGADGNPQVSEVRFAYNAATDTVETYGADPVTAEGIRGGTRPACAALLVDEPTGGEPWPDRGVEIRGRAEAVGLADPVLRIHPDQVLSWGLPRNDAPPPPAAAADNSDPSTCNFGRPGSTPAAGEVFVPVPWNAVIDAAWWAKETTALRKQLQGEFPYAASEAVIDAIQTATRRIAVGARIPNYLPVLVGREARTQLRDRQHERHHRRRPTR